MELEAALSEIAIFGDPTDRTIGIDIVGGPATMQEAALLVRSEQPIFLPRPIGRIVNDHNQDTRSNPGNTRIIADQLRLRWRSSQEIQPKEKELDEFRKRWVNAFPYWAHVEFVNSALLSQ